ncbi:MAG: hypothetical protein JWP87_1590 [Labilithrix sp.]|nr:hypothetical protein [Labilithrix sp.]
MSLPVRVVLALVALPMLAAACSSNGSRARDVAGDRRPRREDPDASAEAGTGTSVPEPPPAVVQAAPIGKKPRPFVRASARALAIDATTLYYGDSEDDGIYAMPKKDGNTVRLARHAPVAGAIAVDAESIMWIASPGDAVLKLPLRGGVQPTTLRDRGIFSDVATAGGDVFITEAIGAGGALLRVTGATASRLVSFDGAPRAVVADTTHAYVITPTKIVRTPHAKGELETIATGAAFANPQIDEGFVYVVGEIDKVRVVLRVPKGGGPPTILAREVRDAPIEIEGGEVLFFDAQRPQVRGVRATGGDVRVVVEDEIVASATAIVADPSTVFVATGARESGLIVAIDRR